MIDSTDEPDESLKYDFLIIGEIDKIEQIKTDVISKYGDTENIHLSIWRCKRIFKQYVKADTSLIFIRVKDPEYSVRYSDDYPKYNSYVVR
jgi:hypothetical protein